MLQRFSSNRDYYHRKKVQAYHRDPFFKQWKYMVITSLPHTKIVIFYTEILTGKVVLWCFFWSERSGKNPQFNFSGQNLCLERNFFKWDVNYIALGNALKHIWCTIAKLS